MVWNKSGYRDNFTKQQLVFMDQAEKAKQQREKESEEKRRAEAGSLENKIIEYLSKERTELSLQEISKGIGEENEANVLKVLNSISRKKIELVVSALDETNSSSTKYKSVT